MRVTTYFSETIERLRFAFTANGKREIRVYVSQFRLENENSEPQMWYKHGHVVISAEFAVCRKRNS